MPKKRYKVEIHIEPIGESKPTMILVKAFYRKPLQWMPIFFRWIEFNRQAMTLAWAIAMVHNNDDFCKLVGLRESECIIELYDHDPPAITFA